MSSQILKRFVLLASLGLGACQSHHPVTATPASEASEKRSINSKIRDNSLALLNDLLSDEKNVSKILIIKKESVELKRLVKDISETSAAESKSLKSLAKKNAALELENTALPPGEQAVRKAISKTKQHVLLHAKGSEFEFQLLLTQADALNYGSHLAMVAAENEPQPELARGFFVLSTRLNQLHERVVAMLRTK